MFQAVFMGSAFTSLLPRGDAPTQQRTPARTLYSTGYSTGAERGKRNTKVVPSPGRLSTVSWPPSVRVVRL